MKMVNRKGFTMVELLIVLAIIAILAAVAIPVYSSQLENARKEVDNSNLRAATGLAAQDYILREAGKTNTANGVYYAVLSFAKGTNNTAAVNSQNMLVYPVNSSIDKDGNVVGTASSAAGNTTITARGSKGGYTLGGTKTINTKTVEVMPLQQNNGTARFVIQIGKGGTVLNSEIDTKEKNT